jgi:hypothetical protein
MQADRRCSAFAVMSEYLSGPAPELAKGRRKNFGENFEKTRAAKKVSAKISRKTLGTSALGERGGRAKKPAQTLPTSNTTDK